MKNMSVMKAGLVAATGPKADCPIFARDANKRMLWAAMPRPEAQDNLERPVMHSESVTAAYLP